MSEIEKREHTVQGVDVYVGELTLNQNKALFQLFEKAPEFKFDAATLKPMEVIKYLFKNDLAEQLYRIIIQGDDENKINIGDITNSEAEALLGDFLELNSPKISEFKNLFLTLTTVISSMKGMKSTESSET